jgi:hypothetical protein
LFFVVTSLRENNAYENELGGAIVTRRRRDADTEELPLPHWPTESMMYRRRGWRVTRYSYEPSAVVPVTVEGGTPPEVSWRFAIASCTPDSAMWIAVPKQLLRPVAVVLWRRV